MVKIQDTGLNAEIRIRAIELIGSTLNTPNNLYGQELKYEVNIQIDTKGDVDQKVLFTVVTVKIENEDHSLLYGSVSVSSVFEVINFEEVVKLEKDGTMNVNPKLVETLNIISLGNTRGVMFSTFRGTFLHNVVLPLVDPRQIPNEKVKKAKS